MKNVSNSELNKAFKAFLKDCKTEIITVSPTKVFKETVIMVKKKELELLPN